MIDTRQEKFEQDVLQPSRHMPVVVDFWAPWCGPCRALGPVLEKVERDYDGKFRLVKVNSDQNPELAQRYRVRSIPYVVAFVDGKPHDAFVGALSERDVRAFVDRLLPNPSELERRKAARLLAAGDIKGGVSALRAAIALNPANDVARLDLAEALLALDAPPLDETQQVLDGLNALVRQEARARSIQTRVDAQRRVARLPDVEVLRERIAADPSDLRARLDLAFRHIASRTFELALEQLLAVVDRDRRFEDEAARKTMLSVFDLMADQPEVVSLYRRRLAAALNR
jgi:putative thioredoxin